MDISAILSPLDDLMLGHQINYTYLSSQQYVNKFYGNYFIIQEEIIPPSFLFPSKITRTTR